MACKLKLSVSFRHQSSRFVYQPQRGSGLGAPARIFRRAGAQFETDRLAGSFVPGGMGDYATWYGHVIRSSRTSAADSGGLLVQALALVGFASLNGFVPWAASAVVLGVGTAAVYPTLIAQVGDLVGPKTRGKRHRPLPHVA